MRSRRPGTVRGTPEHTARVKRGKAYEAEKRRKASQVLMRDVDDAVRNGVVRSELLPHVLGGKEVSLRLLQEHGAEIGPRGAILDLGPVGYAKALQIKNTGVTQQAISVVSQRLGQTGDPELARLLGSLINTQRQNLQALGLDRPEPTVVDLRDYLQQRSESPDSTGDETSEDRIGSEAATPRSNSTTSLNTEDAEVVASEEVQHESGAEAPQTAPDGATEPQS